MPDATQTGKPEVTFRDVFIPVWAHRRTVLILSLSLALLTLGLNFLLPKYYRASAIILPDTDKSRLGTMNQFAGLASLAGVNVAGGDIARLYPVMLTSEAVLRNVVERRYATERFKDSVTLVQYLEINEGSPERDFDEALQRLRGLMTVSLEAKTNVVTAAVEMREPRLAADVMNAALAELDMFLREKKTTNASEQRKWIESRLAQVGAELHQAEEALKDFREKNRRVMDSPQLLLQQERLLREVQVKGTIDVELRKQAEIAKIEEIKQVTTINVLDEGRAPVKKERPKRATNAAIAFFFGLVGTSAYFAIRSLYGGRIREYVASLRR